MLAWYRIAPSLWISLGSGYLVVLASLLVNFEIPSSGSILVCGGIIAEIYHSRWAYRYLLENPKKSEFLQFLLKKEVERNGGAHPLARWSRPTKNDPFELVGGLNEDEVDMLINGASYVDTILSRWVIGSVILGTIIWGYAHLL